MGGTEGGPGGWDPGGRADAANLTERCIRSGQAEAPVRSKASGKTMTNAELNNLKAALQAKRLELTAELRGQARQLRMDGGQAGAIDLMKGMRDRDQTAGMVNRFSSTLADVERALRAIAEDEYGICRECEEPIALKRLKSIPWAACCVRCQEGLEAGEERESRPRFDSLRAA